MADIGWIALRIVGGTIVAIIGYIIGRRFLDAIGLERRFSSDAWRYTLAQLGELILVIFTIGAVVIGAAAVGIARALLE
ncbi:hypothetical protein [Azoarcus sp. CIB]|uniref:hypothetical protein n=1 Tax=Aromatoleum sp. (strain CIB) TaxID=198107 RepID=UPI00067B0548|nr:hypothetical protein [Azoarcus sp. CIB]